MVKPRGELEAIETGICDIGIVVTAFHVDKMPLYNVAFVTSFVSHDLLLVVRTIDELTEQFPEMRQSLHATSRSITAPFSSHLFL